jgi:hypothetical protein
MSTSADLGGARFRPRGDLTSVVLDGELVVYDSSSNALHHLNPVATIVWQQCDGEQTVDAIVERLVRESTEQPEVVRRHVCELIDQLASVSLLVSTDQSSPREGSGS